LKVSPSRGDYSRIVNTVGVDEGCAI